MEYSVTDTTTYMIEVVPEDVLDMINTQTYTSSEITLPSTTIRLMIGEILALRKSSENEENTENTSVQ